MEGLPMVSYSRGSMNSLLHKLTEVMKNSTSEVQGLPRHHVVELLQALTSLDENLVHEVAGRQETDEQVKAWMKQVRQLVVDIEDWVDPKLAVPNSEEPENEEFEDKGDPHLATEDRVDPTLAIEECTNMEEWESKIFKDFMAQIDEACERCTRYELLKEPTDPAVPVDVVPSNESGRQLPQKPVGLVAVHGPIKEIVRELTKEQESLKVVSIVGMEGLGKTTLAKEIHAKLREEFDCHAFVSVSRRKSVSTILMDILHQVNGRPKRESEAIAMITDLREWLETKRYLIIIDGVWSTWEWKVINCSLPDTNRGSRVLITTCNMNVAKSCSIHRNDFIYQMKALSKLDSQSIFGGEAKDDILNICGGMPLAIIVAAGLLPRKTAGLAESKMLWKSDSTSEGMNKILYMSYDYLSLPLKSCFMYLNVFPEDYTINKDRLIRLWRAEGLIPGSYEESLRVTGDRYFNELISRRLIQPVFSHEDDQAVGCTVHGVILDFMASLSREENFVTVGAELKPGPLDTTLPWTLTATPGAELTPGPFLCYETVRRLSLHCRGEGESDNLVSCNVHLSRVRSLIVFKDSYGLPDLWAFKLIRVLDLDQAKTDDNDWPTTSHFLENKPKTSYYAIERLFLLRYLGLAGTSVASKDMQNIWELKYLQTLDVRRTGVQELPSRLPNLVSLLGDGLKFPTATVSCVHTGQDLEELSTIRVNDDVICNIVSELLLVSKKLRILDMYLYGVNTEVLTSFLDKLRRTELESLSISGDTLELDQWAPSPKLRRFKLVRFLLRVPESWAELDSLTHLDVRVWNIKTEGVIALGELPKLVYLRLHSDGSGERGSIIIRSGFQNLEVARFYILHGEVGLHYAHGAMPKLRKLWLTCRGADILQQNRIQFPANLTEVEVRIILGAQMDVEGAKRAIRDQISVHPNPDISFQIYFV